MMPLWRGGEMEEEGGTSCSPSKDFEKLDHKNAIKHEKRIPPLDFLTAPCTPSKEFENDCASMVLKESRSPCLFNLFFFCKFSKQYCFFFFSCLNAFTVCLDDKPFQIRSCHLSRLFGITN